MTKQLKQKTTLSLQLERGEVMTSVEMSKLTNKRHDSVMRTIKFLLDEETLRSTSCGTYKTEQGNEYPMYLFDKVDSLVIAARLSPKFMTAIIDRWLELEQKQIDRANWLEARQKVINSNKYYNVCLDELYKSTHDNKNTPHHVYSNEANMIDTIVLGCNAKEYRERNNLNHVEALRDFLTDEQNNLIDILQKRDAVYIEDGLSYKERKIKLLDFANKYRIKLLK